MGRGSQNGTPPVDPGEGGTGGDELAPGTFGGGGHDALLDWIVQSGGCDSANVA